jgi:hypothetical protein
MTVLTIIGWALLIAANMLPEKWFKTKTQMYQTRMVMAGLATCVFVYSLIKLWVR